MKTFDKSDLVVGLTLLLIICVGLGMITMDYMGFFYQVEPPSFERDFVPERQEVCKELSGGTDRVLGSNTFWESLGWPAWPTPTEEYCEYEHDTAPDGVVRWHSCNSMTRQGPNKLITIPCPPDKAGKTLARVDEEGKVKAVDIYIKTTENDCRYEHEGGHARGLGLGPIEHTLASGHLMGEKCGRNLRWLDRTEGGDWPYGVGSNK